MDPIFTCQYFCWKQSQTSLFPFSPYHLTILCLSMCVYVCMCAHIHIFIFMNLSQILFANAHYKSEWTLILVKMKGKKFAQWHSPHFLHPATCLGTYPTSWTLMLPLYYLGPFSDILLPCKDPLIAGSTPPLPLVKCCYLGSSSHKMVLSPSCLTENVMKKKCILDEKSELPYTTNWSCSLGLKSLNFLLWKKWFKNETCTAYLIGQLCAKSIQLVCDSRGIWE